MTVQRSCDLEDCPHRGKREDRKEKTFRQWLDQIVMGVFALLLVVTIGVIRWFGGTVQGLTEKVQGLSEVQIAYLERLSNFSGELARLRYDFDAHMKEDSQHLKDALQHAQEDRQKFYLVGRQSMVPPPVRYRAPESEQPKQDQK